MFGLLQAFQNYFIIPLKYIEYGVYRDLIRIYAKPYSIYLRGTLCAGVRLRGRGLQTSVLQAAKSVDILITYNIGDSQHCLTECSY